MAERQWPLPPAENPKDLYVWAQELTRLLTQRLNPLLVAAALSSSVSVRAATTANIDISADLENGDSIDGVTLATGDLVLVKDQSSGEENGIYRVPASGAAKRTGDFITYDAHVGAIVTVQEGTTNGGTTWQGTSSRGGTLGTTAIAFAQFGTLTSPVSFSDIQDIATSRLLGRATAGTGPVEQLTLSQALDLIGSAAWGDVLYRGENAWARLPAGTAGQFLQTQGAGADPQFAAASAALLHVRDQKPSGTDAGDAANGGTQIRDLNTVVTNEISGASLSGNRITLPAGDYSITATVPFKRCDGTQARLLNDTDTEELVRGTSVFQEDSNVDGGGLLVIFGRFTLDATKDVAIQQYTGSNSGDSLGLASGSGWGEVYTDVQIRKL